MLATAVSAVAVLSFAAPSAYANINGEITGTAVTSSRSFPSYTVVRQDLTVEATSTDAEDGADWGSTESLDVPHTKSQAQKDQEEAEARAKAAAEEAAQAQAQAQAEAEQQAQAASRSAERTSQSSTTTTPTTSGTTEVSGNAGSAIAAAYALIGQSMDCTALVSAALAAGGINFHGWPEEYAQLGKQVTDPQPGDILIYRYTGGWNGGVHWDHVALYVGNGQAIHGGWNGSTVALAGMMEPDLIIRVF
ncbi:NlpC/P60 family protein [Bifidobacterium aerophilum]|nr:NlpC/P60 family protein [Bifidobacterium aerophilum]